MKPIFSSLTTARPQPTTKEKSKTEKGIQRVVDEGLRPENRKPTLRIGGPKPGFDSPRLRSGGPNLRMVSPDMLVMVVKRRRQCQVVTWLKFYSEQSQSVNMMKKYDI